MSEWHLEFFPTCRTHNCVKHLMTKLLEGHVLVLLFFSNRNFCLYPVNLKFLLRNCAQKHIHASRSGPFVMSQRDHFQLIPDTWTATSLPPWLDGRTNRTFDTVETKQITETNKDIDSDLTITQIRRRNAGISECWQRASIRSDFKTWLINAARPSAASINI